jgi:hypothetical protein
VRSNEIQINSDTLIDPASWRVIRLRWEDPEGWVEADLLGGPDWLGQLGAAQVGDAIELNLPEMGCEGQASILAIEPCPELEFGSGRVVTGLFRHSAGQLYDLSLEGSSEPIGITALHPVWSVDARAWISASELVAGARLTGLSGEAILRTMLPRAIEPVYNIEVDADHCYRVGEQGLLVHNASVLYRGDKSGMRSMGFDSYESRSRGRTQAMGYVLGLSSDELEKKMEEHAGSKFLSAFVSTTSDIRVACYFATNGCNNAGSIYVITQTSLAKKNTFNKTLITLCDKKTVVGESEWVWFAYIDPKYIVSKMMVMPDDCNCLPNS